MKNIYKFGVLICLVFIQVIATTNAQWVSTNGPYGGSFYSFVVSGSTIFAGTDGGGVYRSADNGTNWILVNTGLPNKNIYALTVSGTTLFAGSYGGGIYRSTDNGANWTAVNTGLTNQNVRALAVSGTTIFAGTNGGVFRSTDNGANWTTSGLTNQAVTALAVSGTTLFAGGNGVYRSIDNGTSWTASGLTNQSVWSIAVKGTMLFAGTSGGGGVYRSTDNGANWTVSGFTGYDIYAVVVSGTTIFAAPWGGGVHRSTDDGANWVDVNTGLTNINIYALAVRGTTLFAGTYGAGIFRSTDNGANWSTVGANRGALALASSGTTIFASAGDNGVYLISDNGTNWTASGLTNQYVQSIAVYGTSLFAASLGGGIFRSTDNGTNWAAVNTGLTNLYVQAIAVSGTILIAGTLGGGIFRSIDNGANWTATSLTSQGVLGFAVSGSTLFAGTDNSGIFRSTDNGANWVAVNNGLTNQNVRAFAVRGTTIFAGTYGGGIFRSVDNGANWTAVNTGLTSLDIHKFAVSGTLLFAGTWGGGVNLSMDNGANWTEINTGLSNQYIYSLAVNGPTLFAGTYGSGVWKLDISLPNPIITGTATVCMNQTGVTYSVQSVSGHTYQWSPLTRGTIIGSTTNNSISVNWTQSGVDTVRMRQTITSTGFYKDTSFVVSINPQPVPIITGAPSVCLNQTNVVYKVPFVVGHSYQWQSLKRGSIVGSSTRDNLVINWTSSGLDTVRLRQTIAVTGCYKDTNFIVTINPLPTPVITGPNLICSGQLQSYSVPSNSDRSYQWFVSSRGAISNGATSNNATILWTNSGATQTTNDTVRIRETITLTGCSKDTMVVVSINPLPAPVIKGAPSACMNQTSVFYTVPFAAGHNYQWQSLKRGSIVGSTTRDSAVINWTSSGIDTIRLRQTISATGCYKDTNFIVNINPIPVPAISGSTSVCANQQKVGYSTPNNSGSSYEWTILSGNATINGDQTANTVLLDFTNQGKSVLQVRERSSSGCLKDTTLTITIGNGLTPTITTQSGRFNFCPGGSVTLDAGIAGGVYQWKLSGTVIAGATSKTYLASQTGNYSVTVTSNGCSGTSGTQLVTESALPTPVISGSTSVCANQSGVNYTTIKNTGSTYQWSVVSGNASLIGATIDNTVKIDFKDQGKVVLRVQETNSNGCIKDTNLDITIGSGLTPIITSQSGSSSFCPGSSITLDAGITEGTFQWKKDGNAIKDSIKSTLQVNQAGRYSVFVSSKGCSGSSIDYPVFESPLPIPVISGSTSVCANQTGVNYTTTKNTGSTYQWSVVSGNAILNGATTDNTVSIDFKDPGKVVLRVQETNSNGCIKDTNIDVTIGSGLTPIITSQSGSFSFCPGSSITLEAGIAGGTYQWKKDGNAIKDSVKSTLQVNQAGLYSVFVSSNGCSGSSIDYPVLESPLPTPKITQNGDELQTSLFNVYQWYDTNGKIDNAINQTYKPGKPGVYYVQVTNAAGCEARSESFNFLGIGTSSILISMKVEPDSAKPGEQVQVILSWNPPDKDSGSFNGRLYWNTRIADCITPDSTVEKHYGKNTGGISFKNLQLHTGSYTVPLEILLGDETLTRIILDSSSLSSSNSTKRLIPNMIDSIITVTGVTCDNSGIPRLVTWKNPPSVTVTVLPNPSASTSTISVEPKTAEGLVELYSVYGDKILTTTLRQGSVQINSMNLSDGVYSIVVRTADGIGRTTMVVVK